MLKNLMWIEGQAVFAHVDGRRGGPKSSEMPRSLARRRGVLALAGAGLLALTGCERQAEAPPSRSNAAGPEQAVTSLMGLVLPDLDGGEQALAAWQGQAMLINFWATWCAPCVHEMPDLDALQAEFPQVRFVGLGIDSLENMRQFRERVPVSYPLLGARAVGLDLMKQLGNTAGGLPYTLLLDARGQIRRQVAGQIDPAALRRDLQQLA